VSAAAFALIATSAQAGDVDQELQEMRDLVAALQDQVDNQQRQMEAAGLEEERGAKSAVSSFLEMTSFSGHIAASYNYNATGASKKESTGSDIIGQNSGSSSGAPNGLPFYPNSNTFQLDQLWFAIDKDVSAESRAGFHADLLYGSAASFFNGSFLGFSDPESGDDGNDFSLFTAYVSYLAPIGDGVRIDAGRMGTLFGAEVVDTTANFNITRGLVWNLQPVNNTGAIASTDIGPVSLATGFVNQAFSDPTGDINNNKAFVIQGGWSNDMFGANAGMTYGAVNGGDESDKVGMFDLVVTVDPIEQLSLWLNYDHLWNNFNNTCIDGIAVAGRFEIMEGTGISTRLEYVAFTGGGAEAGGYSFTLTGDHMLTTGLTAKLEYRLDGGDTDQFNPDASWVGMGFPTRNGSYYRDLRHVLLAQLIYSF
jgi:hypothetical protein